MSKTGRNDPCPCGSGQKYKRCCLPQEKERAHQRAREQNAERLAAFAAEQARRKQMREERASWGQGDEESEQLVNDSNAIIDMVRAGQLDEAEAAAHAFLERFPYIYDGYDRLGMVEEARGNPKAAANWYRKCLEFLREHREDFDPELTQRYEGYIARLDPATSA